MLLVQEELELKILKDSDQIISQKTFAQNLGYSVGKVNYILKSLIEKGFIKTERFVNSDNKLQYKYLLTEKGIKEKIKLTEKFIQIKKSEYDELQQDLQNYKKELDSDTVIGVGITMKQVHLETWCRIIFFKFYAL